MRKLIRSRKLINYLKDNNEKLLTTFNKAIVKITQQENASFTNLKQKYIEEFDMIADQCDASFNALPTSAQIIELAKAMPEPEKTNYTKLAEIERKKLEGYNESFKTKRADKTIDGNTKLMLREDLGDYRQRLINFAVKYTEQPDTNDENAKIVEGFDKEIQAKLDVLHELRSKYIAARNDKKIQETILKEINKGEGEEKNRIKEKEEYEKYKEKYNGLPALKTRFSIKGGGGSRKKRSKKAKKSVRNNRKKERKHKSRKQKRHVKKYTKRNNNLRRGTSSRLSQTTQ